jgi:hypothetical protein
MLVSLDEKIFHFPIKSGRVELMEIYENVRA